MNAGDHEVATRAEGARALFTGKGRETFFEAQRRNRRATWRLSVVSVFATLVMGIPSALTVTPVLYAAGLIVAEVLNIWFPLPASFWRNANDLAHSGLLAINWVLQQGRVANPEGLAVGAGVLLLPGTILSLGLWLGLN